MKTRSFTLVCMLILAFKIGFSQSGLLVAEPIYSHTVYRLDGSVLKGEITEWTTDYIGLRMLSGLEIKIETAEVRKVVSRNVPRSTTRDRRGVIERAYSFKESGMYHVTTTSMSAGPYAGFGVNHAVGYRFSRLFSVGGGLGVETFEAGSGNQIVPLFVEVRGFFMNQNISPYYALRAGYGFSIRDPENGVTETNGGRMLGAELGYRFGGARAVNFFAGVGVHFQNATYVTQWPWEERFTDEVKHRRTELKVGVIF